MKLAVFTDSSAYLSEETLQREDLFVLIFLSILMVRNMSKASICLLRNLPKNGSGF